MSTSEHVTLVDSKYCDPVQVIDIYLRLARRVVDGVATSEEKRFAGTLVTLTEICGGIY